MQHDEATSHYSSIIDQMGMGMRCAGLVVVEGTLFVIMCLLGCVLGCQQTPLSCSKVARRLEPHEVRCLPGGHTSMCALSPAATFHFEQSLFALPGFCVCHAKAD